MANIAANGEVLDILGDKIEQTLKDPKLRKTDRALLEIQQLFVVYLRDDHKRLNEIYPFAMDQKKKSAEGDREWKDTKIYYTRIATGTVIGSLFGAATTAVIGWLAYAFQIKPVLDALAQAGK